MANEYRNQAGLSNLVAMTDDERAADHAYETSPDVRGQLLTEIRSQRDPMKRRVLEQAYQQDFGEPSPGASRMDDVQPAALPVFDMGALAKAGGITAATGRASAAPVSKAGFTFDMDALMQAGLAGAKPSSTDQPRSVGDMASDAATGFAKGAGSLAKSAGWLIGNKTLQGIGEDAEKFWSEKQSAGLKQQLQNFEQSEGFVGALVSMKDNPAALGDMIVQSLPLMVPGMAVGGLAARPAAAIAHRLVLRAGASAEVAAAAAEKAAIRVAMASNIAGEGVTQGGSTGADVEADALKHGATPEQAKAAANEAAIKSGLWTAAGAGVGARMESQAMLGKLRDKGFTGAANNIGKEALEEAIQNPGSDYAEYEGKAKFDPNAKYDFGKSVATGIATGGAMGAGFHGAGRAANMLAENGQDPAAPPVTEPSTPDPALGLPNYAGAPLVVFADGSTMTRAEAEQRYSAEELARLEAMVQPADQEVKPIEPAPKTTPPGPQTYEQRLANMALDAESVRAEELKARQLDELQRESRLPAALLDAERNDRLAVAAGRDGSLPTKMQEAFANARQLKPQRGPNGNERPAAAELVATSNQGPSIESGGSAGNAPTVEGSDSGVGDPTGTSASGSETPAPVGSASVADAALTQANPPSAEESLVAQPGGTTQTAAPAQTPVPSPQAQPEPVAAAPSLQPRDRSRLASTEQMRSIAANPDYGRLGPSRAPETGAPMAFAVGDAAQIPSARIGREDVAVMSDGSRVPFRYAVVDASAVQPSHFADGSENPAYGEHAPGTIKALNNGRVAGLRAAYDQGSAERYTLDLMQDAEQHGIPPEVVANIKSPVLVRLYSEQANVGDMGGKSQGATLGMSLTEQAVADAARIDDTLLAQYSPTDIVGAGNRDFVRGFVGQLPDAELASMMDADGNLSQDGKRRIEAALMQAAYGNADLVTDLFESTDTDIAAIGKAMKQVAGRWATMRSAAKNGQISAEFDTTPNLVDALNIVRRARAEGRPVAELAGQGDLMSGNFIAPLTELFLRMFYRGQNYTRARSGDKVLAGLSSYVDGALAAKAGDMFGDTDSVTPTRILGDINRKADQDENRPASQAGLFGANGQPTADAVPTRSASPAQSGTDGQRSVSGSSSEPAGQNGSGQQEIAPRAKAIVEEVKKARAKKVAKTEPVSQQKAEAKPEVAPVKAEALKETAPESSKPAVESAPVESQAALSDEQPTVDEAAHEAATSPQNDNPEPTQAQIEAGNYAKGHINVGGLDISIENPEGSTRSGTDADGKPWQTTMRSHYGYVKGTIGRDGDHVDVFVKAGTPNDYSGPVFVIDQKKANGHFDEHKALIGWTSETGARVGYLANYAKGWKGLGPVTRMEFDQFKTWLNSGDTTKRASEQAPASQFVTYETNDGKRVTLKRKDAEGSIFLLPTYDANGQPLKNQDGGPLLVKRVDLKAPAAYPAKAGVDEQPVSAPATEAEAAPAQASETVDATEEIITQADAVEPAAPELELVPVTAEDRLRAKSQAHQVADFGEKIGGARKDKAVPLGPRLRMEKAEDERPAWARKFHVFEVKALPGRINQPNVGKWQIMVDAGGTMKGAVKPASRSVFDTEQEALDAIPLVAVGQKHAVYAQPTGDAAQFGIYRNITDRKRALVKGGFASREEALRYMAEHAAEVIEHKFPFPDRPWLDRIERTGPERRSGDVTTKMFQDTFGFRAGEFGNWNMGGDGQAALNHAYDALLDLADAIKVPPKAISLNGELAIAFGARGTGGKNSAAAHYEPDRAVINLTKIKGAGSAAHEWWHAVDHFFARNGGYGESQSVVSDSFPPAGRSEARPELIAAIKNVVDTIMHSERSTTTDADLVRQRAQKRIDEAVKSLDYYLNDLRQPYQPKKPFTPGQLKQWDALADKLRAGELGDEVYIENPSKQRGAMGFTTGSNLRDLNAIYKTVTGRSFLRNDPDSQGRRMYWTAKAIADNKASLAVKEDVTTTIKGRSEFFIEAKRIDGYRSGDYWSMPEEMGARAFESYVFDKLTEGQQRSDYLVYAVENRYYAALDMKPYPEGSERQRIDAAFDNLFETIETKETDRGMTMLSRRAGAGMARRDAQAVLDRIAPTFKNLPKIHLLDSVSQAPKELQADIRKLRGWDDAEAALHNGEFYVFLNHLSGEERLEHVLFEHEVRHYGFDNVFGDQKDALLGDLWVKSPGLQVKALALKKRLGLESNIAAVEELLADMPAEDMAKLKGWHRVTLAIRDWLQAHGFDRMAKQLTDLLGGDAKAADLMAANMVRQAQAYAKDGSPSGRLIRGTKLSAPDAARAALEWKSQTANAVGPVYQGTGFTLEAAQKLDTTDDFSGDDGLPWGHAAHVQDEAFRFSILDGKGNLAGFMDAEVNGLGEISAIHDMAIDAPGKGFGSKVVETIMASTYDGVRIIEALDQSKPFWNRLGAQGYDQYQNTRLDFDGSPAAARADHAETAGRSGQEGGEGGSRLSRASQAAALNSRIVGDSSRAYTPEQKAFFERTGRTIDVPTIKERVASLWKDAGKKLAQGVVDQFAPIKELGGQAYTLARLSKGAPGALEAFLHHGKLKLTDGVYDADTSGGVVDRLAVPLHGEMEDFLWWVAAHRAERLSAEDREHLFTPDDIAAGKSLHTGTTDFDYTLQHGANAGTVTRDRTLIFADSLKTYDEFNRSVMDIAEQSGLIDGAARKIWEHEMYVPFYRASEEEGGFVGARIGQSLVRQTAFKQLKGGTDKLNSDLLANTLQNWAHLIDAAAKNRAAKATLETASRLGAATPVAGSMAEYAASNGKMLPPGTKKTVWHMVDGQKKEYRVDDPYLMTAISSLEYAGMRGPIMNTLSAFKHWLTMGVTASPAFKVRNLIRDSLQAIATGDLSYNPAKNVAQGWKLTDRASQDYVSMLASGALIRFGTMEDSHSDKVRRLVSKGADAATILDSPNKMKSFYSKYLEPGIDAYNELGNRGEEINRAALYKQLRDKGIDHAQASLMARDLMDFSMQGSWNTIRFLSQVVPFFNARLVGLYKLGRAAKEDPARFATVLGAAALASIALLAAYHDDDDWKKREDWDRESYWWFKFGGVAFRLPKPFEIGAIATLAERSVEYLTDQEMTGKRLGKRIMAIAENQLSMNPVPQAVKPIIDLYANKDSFTKRPIESAGMEKLDPEYRYNAQSSMTARALSTGTGGALSPVQYDHLVRSYFGWLGSFAVGAADMAIRPITNEPTRPTVDYWRLGTQGFLSELPAPASRYVSQMYEQAKVLEQAYGTYTDLIKRGKIEAAKEFAQEHADQLAKYHSVETIKKAEAKFNQAIRLIENSGIPADEKKTKILALQQGKDKLARMVAPGYSQQ